MVWNKWWMLEMNFSSILVKEVKFAKEKNEKITKQLA